MVPPRGHPLRKTGHPLPWHGHPGNNIPPPMIEFTRHDLALLLPLTPAFVLFKKLPSQAIVKGPFKGLNLQLSGAFAGYFTLALIMQGYVLLRPKPAPPFEVYEVDGKLINVDPGSVEDFVKLMCCMTK